MFIVRRKKKIELRNWVVSLLWLSMNQNNIMTRGQNYNILLK